MHFEICMIKFKIELSIKNCTSLNYGWEKNFNRLIVLIPIRCFCILFEASCLHKHLLGYESDNSALISHLLSRPNRVQVR